MDPKTLYKLMILYMLNQVNFPLIESQISNFFLSSGYTSFYNLMEVLNELTEANFIRKESAHNSSRYTIMEQGNAAYKMFASEISPAILEDINSYIQENKIKMRTEADTISEYYKDENGDFIVHLEILEGKSRLIDIKLAVPDEENAIRMSDNWQNKSLDIYQTITMKLISEGKLQP